MKIFRSKKRKSRSKERWQISFCRADMARVNVVFYWNSGLHHALNFIFANFLSLIMEYFIGVDIGTTNAKAVAMTAAGKILGEERAAYPSIQKLPGQFEQDPE